MTKDLGTQLGLPREPYAHAQPDPAFWAGLFDFSFTRFITLKFIRVIYIILVAMIGLVGLLLFFVSLASGHGVGGVFVAFSAVPLFTLFWIIVTRLTLEGIVVIFRIGENTTRIANAEEARTSAVE